MIRKILQILFCLCFFKLYAMAETFSNHNNKGFNDTVVFDLMSKPLTDNGATNYYTLLSIGTPAQKIKVMLDTGTFNNWLTSSYCNTAACNKHLKFSPSKSSSFKYYTDPKHPQKYDFGPWGLFYAFKGSDQVQINGLQQDYRILFPNLLFASSYKGYNFTNLVPDGGLAVPPLPGNKTLSLVELLYGNYINRSIIAFYHNKVKGNGEVRFGSYDTTKFIESSLVTFDIDLKKSAAKGLWTNELKSFKLKDKILHQNLDFVLDTGSSRFKGDPKIINNIINKITKGGKLPTVLPVNNPKFDRYDDIYIEIGDADSSKTYKLTPETYFLKVLDKGKEIYKLGFYPFNDPTLKNTLLVGTLFLEQVYVIFDFDNKKVSIANLK